VSIESFRDLAVCILGFGATAAIIFIAILALLFYRKISPILDSTKATVKTVEELFSCVEREVAKPLAQVVAFVHGITQAVNMVGRFTGRKEGGRHER
jgi:uncharacterized protein YoxC